MRCNDADNAKHFLSVGQDDLFDEVDPENPAIEYWGYLRVYTPRNDSTKAFKALQFRIEDLNKILPKFGAPEDVSDTLKAFRKCLPMYLFDVDKARMPKDKSDTKPTSALIFKIEEMTFLQEERRQHLLERFVSTENKKL